MSAMLDGFAPVTLQELDAEAGLQTRVDRKYLVPRDAVPAVLDRLDDARALELPNGSRGSRYESVYFDTPDMLGYRLAAGSRRRRFKVRSRTYLDAGASFLEVKTRGGRGLTVKDRLELHSAPDELLGRERRYVDEVLAACGIRPIGALRRTLVTRYRRSTLLLTDADGAGRVTIDLDLEWRDAASDRAPELRLPGAAIIETKSAGSASSADRALWRLGHRPMPISKYATGLAAMHPELPGNRWHRVIETWFREAVPTPASTPPPRVRRTPDAPRTKETP